MKNPIRRWNWNEEAGWQNSLHVAWDFGVPLTYIEALNRSERTGERRRFMNSHRKTPVGGGLIRAGRLPHSNRGSAEVVWTEFANYARKRIGETG
jgi:hypothetical protein